MAGHQSPGVSTVPGVTTLAPIPVGASAAAPAGTRLAA